VQTGDFNKAAELLETTANFDIIKIKAGLDIQMYKEILWKCQKKFPFYKKDNQDTYEGLALQYYDEDNPYSDGVDQADGSNNYQQYKDVGYQEYLKTGKNHFDDWQYDRSKLNDAGEMFRPFFDLCEEKFPDLHLYRARLLRTHPHHFCLAHVDEPKSLRIHLPIESHQWSIMYFLDKPYYLKADGSIYLCNTGHKFHSFYNFSSKLKRTHLVVNAKLKSDLGKYVVG
tara:strand:+ start:1835 stop:2518 length:684 start_codon:yes stop_codon:yes gene_type:complete